MSKTFASSYSRTGLRTPAAGGQLYDHTADENGKHSTKSGSNSRDENHFNGNYNSKHHKTKNADSATKRNFKEHKNNIKVNGVEYAPKNHTKSSQDLDTNSNESHSQSSTSLIHYRVSNVVVQVPTAKESTSKRCFASSTKAKSDNGHSFSASWPNIFGSRTTFRKSCTTNATSSMT